MARNQIKIKIKERLNIILHPFAGPACWADFYTFWHRAFAEKPPVDGFAWHLVRRLADVITCVKFFGTWLRGLDSVGSNFGLFTN